MYQNKVVIITGGSSGIGKALAFSFLKRGAKVVISGRNSQNLKQTEAEFSAFSNQFLTFCGDVSIENDCKNLIDFTVQNFKKVDILVNNAGISMRSLFANTQPDVIKKVMDINFWGTVFCTKYALPYLLDTKGVVVGISSIAGFKGLPARTGYSASKFAMHGFLEALRIENLKTGLHVLIACPGFTASNIRNVALRGDGTAQGETPRDEQKMMQPDEVAEHILKAIQQKKNTLVLTTQGKLIVLLNKFFPKFMDKQVFNHLSKEPDSPFQ
jgi:short-subunit dehydrogenase